MGPNRTEAGRSLSILRKLGQRLLNPLVAILLVAAAVPASAAILPVLSSLPPPSQSRSPSILCRNTAPNSLLISSASASAHLMRHHQADRRLPQEATRHAAEYPLPEPAMSIATCHDEVRVLFPRQPYQTTRVRLRRVNTNIALTDGTVALEIPRDIADTRPCAVLLIRCAKLDNRDP